MMRFSMMVSAAFATVHQLTTDNFNDFVNNNSPVLVKFYAPWCGHCKQMAPEFEAAATELEGTCALADVDATVEGKLAQDHGVGGYPTLKYFVKGVPQDYEGGRTKDTIVEWVQNMSKDSVTEVTEVSEPLATKANIVLYAPTLLEDFKNLADANRMKASFFYVKSDTTKVTYQHKGEEVAVLTETISAASLAKFYSENKFPLVGVLDGDTFEAYSESDIGIVWFLFPMEDGELQSVAEKNMPFMVEVAKVFKGRFSMTYTDTHQFGQALEGMLGVTEFPAIVVQKKVGSKQNFHYEISGDLDAKNVIKFVEDIEAGIITAKIKSEPIPEEQGNVKVVVADTLKEIVFSKTKDVLFEVYAPWCGHCKSLEPEYEKLAAKVVKDIDEFVTIAKMDGTANDSPVDSIEWSGFPSIFYIKAGSDDVTKYEGARDAAGMWKYIKENHSTSDDLVKTLVAKHGDSTEAHDEL